MRAYELTGFGGPEVLRLGTRQEPVPGPREVVVDTRAIGLNPIDVLQRSGAFRFANPARFPLVPGNEFSGVVSAIGADVTAVSVGDNVFARTGKARLGALAERVAIEEALVAPMPRSLGFVTAAAAPPAGSTALQAIRDALEVRPGDRLLLTGGSGMVGLFAIQLAARAGASVTTTASAGSAALLRELGADRVIDYRTQAIGDELFDKVFDLVGGPSAGTLPRVVAPGGRARRGGYGYRFLSMRPSGDDLRELGALIDDGALRVKIDSTYGFEQADEAFARVETRRAKGKVVVVR